MTEPSAAIVALRDLVNGLAILTASKRHGTETQAQEAQKLVDMLTSKAWSVLHEHDHTRAEPDGNYPPSFLDQATIIDPRMDPRRHPFLNGGKL